MINLILTASSWLMYMISATSAKFNIAGGHLLHDGAENPETDAWGQ